MQDSAAHIVGNLVRPLPINQSSNEGFAPHEKKKTLLPGDHKVFSTDIALVRTQRRDLDAKKGGCDLDGVPMLSSSDALPGKEYRFPAF